MNEANSVGDGKKFSAYLTRQMETGKIICREMNYKSTAKSLSQLSAQDIDRGSACTDHSAHTAK